MGGGGVGVEMGIEIGETDPLFLIIIWIGIFFGVRWGGGKVAGVCMTLEAGTNAVNVRSYTQNVCRSECHIVTLYRNREGGERGGGKCCTMILQLARDDGGVLVFDQPRVI